MLELLFDKAAGLKACKFIKNICFPVNVANFFRTACFIDHLWWLLLCCDLFEFNWTVSWIPVQWWLKFRIIFWKWFSKAWISDAIKKVLPVSSPSTFFAASTLWTIQLRITSSTTKRHIPMQNLYKPIVTAMMKVNGLPKT